MKKESIVWQVGCLFISMLLMLPSTSLADDKNKESHDQLESSCKKEQGSPKTACEEFDLKFKPRLNREGDLLFKDLYLKLNYGFTNETGTSGMLGQFGVAAQVEKTPTYGITFGYKDKAIVSNIMKFFPDQSPGDYTLIKDIFIDPIKLTAQLSYGKTLKTTIEPGKEDVADHYPIKTTYNIEMNPLPGLKPGVSGLLT